MALGALLRPELVHQVVERGALRRAPSIPSNAAQSLADMGDLRRPDTQLAELKERLAAVVAASGTTTTKIFGVGPVMAAITVGLTRDVRRFADKDHFAAYNGIAPIEVSSGPKKIFRLSMRGNRQLNHTLHMTAVTQVRHRHSEGRAYYERKVAEGKTGKEALPALKRRISDALYAAMVADARREEQASGGSGGKRGTAQSPARPDLTPQNRLFGQATPGPAPSLGHRDSPLAPFVYGEIRRKSAKPLDIRNKEDTFGMDSP